MSPVVALAGKDLRLLVRDRAGFFFTLVWPLLFAIVFGSVFSRGPGDSDGVPIALVDEDASEGSKALVDALEKGDAVEVMRVDTRDRNACSNG